MKDPCGIPFLAIALALAASAAEQDLETIHLKYSQLNQERNKVYQLKQTLEARRKWLEDYEAGKTDAAE